MLTPRWCRSTVDAIVRIRSSAVAVGSNCARLVVCSAYGEGHANDDDTITTNSNGTAFLFLQWRPTVGTDHMWVSILQQRTSTYRIVPVCFLGSSVSNPGLQRLANCPPALGHLDYRSHSTASTGRVIEPRMFDSNNTRSASSRRLFRADHGSWRVQWQTKWRLSMHW